MTLRWPAVGSFRVTNSREVLITPRAGTPSSIVRHFLFGPVLAVLLHQRGRLVLHASAVAMPGGAVAFLGASGWGKSTTAAALHARGHAVLTDDVLPVDLTSGRPIIAAGIPELKLWPRSAAVLGRGDLESRPVARGLQKRIHALPRLDPGAAPPLRAIYVLAHAARPGIEPLSPRQALVELVRHSYCARLLAAGGGADHFRQCATVSGTTSVSRLLLPRLFTSLPDMAHAAAHLVERDLAGAPAPPIA